MARLVLTVVLLVISALCADFAFAEGRTEEILQTGNRQSVHPASGDGLQSIDLDKDEDGSDSVVEDGESEQMPSSE